MNKHCSMIDACRTMFGGMPHVTLELWATGIQKVADMVGMDVTSAEFIEKFETAMLSLSTEPKHGIDTQCYGLFYRRSSGEPKPCKLIDERVFFTVNDAHNARKEMLRPQDIEIRKIVLRVEHAVTWWGVQ